MFNTASNTRAPNPVMNAGGDDSSISSQNQSQRNMRETVTAPSSGGRANSSSSIVTAAPTTPPSSSNTHTHAHTQPAQPADATMQRSSNDTEMEMEQRMAEADLEASELAASRDRLIRSLPEQVDLVRETLSRMIAADEEMEEEDDQIDRIVVLNANLARALKHKCDEVERLREECEDVRIRAFQSVIAEMEAAATNPSSTQGILPSRVARQFLTAIKTEQSDSESHPIAKREKSASFATMQDARQTMLRRDGFTTAAPRQDSNKEKRLEENIKSLTNKLHASEKRVSSLENELNRHQIDLEHNKEKLRDETTKREKQMQEERDKYEEEIQLLRQTQQAEQKESMHVKEELSAARARIAKRDTEDERKMKQKCDLAAAAARRETQKLHEREMQCANDRINRLQQECQQLRGQVVKTERVRQHLEKQMKELAKQHITSMSNDSGATRVGGQTNTATANAPIPLPAVNTIIESFTRPLIERIESEEKTMETVACTPPTTATDDATMARQEHSGGNAQMTVSQSQSQS